MHFFFRIVYKWFYLIYKACCFLGLAGYFLTMATLVGFPIIFGIKPYIFLDMATLVIFYGLYYGVLGRDVAEVCADTMASHIGVSYWVSYVHIYYPILISIICFYFDLWYDGSSYLFYVSFIYFLLGVGYLLSLPCPSGL